MSIFRALAATIGHDTMIEMFNTYMESVKQPPILASSKINQHTCPNAPSKPPRFEVRNLSPIRKLSMPAETENNMTYWS